MTDWLSDNRRFLLRLIGTLLAIGLILALVRGQGWDEIRAALKQISTAQFLSGLGLVLLSRFFVMTRWYILLRSGGVKIPFSRVVALTFTGLFASNFLPTTIGGDVVRLAGAMQMGFDRAVCLASIAADRLIGVLGMAFVAPLGLFPTMHSLSPAPAQAVSLTALLQKFWGFIKRTMQTFSLWFKQPMALLAALVFTWGHMLCTFLAFSLVIKALGAEVPFWLLAGLWSLAYFVTLVPISINGYGVQELSLTFLFSTVGGLSTAISLTAAVVMRVLYMIASLPGAVYMPTILAAMDLEREPELKD